MNLIAKLVRNGQALFVAADTQAELDHAIREVQAGVPMIGSTMRVRGTEVRGGVVFIDKEAQTARLGDDSRPYAWSTLEYPS